MLLELIDLFIGKNRFAEASVNLENISVTLTRYKTLYSWGSSKVVSNGELQEPAEFNSRHSFHDFK